MAAQPGTARLGLGRVVDFAILGWMHEREGEPKLDGDVGSSGTLTQGEIAAAAAALGNSETRVPARSWPSGPTDLDQTGLYAWWVDLPGAAMLSDGLGVEIAAGRVYAGQAGATAWPSGKRRDATLRSRIGGNHIRGSVRGSTFRLTLAAVLRGPLELQVAGPRKLGRGSEQRLTTWILTHLEVGVHPFPDADRLGELEQSVLSLLDPPMNLEGMPLTSLRTQLSALRCNITVRVGR